MVCAMGCALELRGGPDSSELSDPCQGPFTIRPQIVLAHFPRRYAPLARIVRDPSVAPFASVVISDSSAPFVRIVPPKDGRPSCSQPCNGRARQSQRMAKPAYKGMLCRIRATKERFTRKSMSRHRRPGIATRHALNLASCHGRHRPGQLRSGRTRRPNSRRRSRYLEARY
jgi:hypothetical protein